MLLYEFNYSDTTDFDSFLKMMREKYPHIVNRKRLCVHPEEITDALRKDLEDQGVTLEEIDQ